MSLPRDLDDYDDKELYDELLRRNKQRALGHCDYCKRGVSLSPCKYPMRHQVMEDSYGFYNIQFNLLNAIKESGGGLT